MDEQSRLRAVFWDIGGVILSLESVQRAHEAFVSDLCAEFPCREDPENALSRWRSVVGEYFDEREEMAFRPAREAYAQAVDEILENELPREEWRPIFREAADEHLRPIDDAVDTVRILQQRDLHVGVISDVDHVEGRRILEGFGLFAGMDSYTTSEAVGKTKPHPRMFETALDAVAVPPERALMIGDRYRNDMEGAANVGMVTVGYGSRDGPAVDYRIDSLGEVIDIVDRL